MVNTFLSGHLNDVRAIINSLKQEFDSHAFIQQYSEKYEREYITFLVFHLCSNEAFRTVHSEIGRFLGNHTQDLSIEKLDKVDSLNIHGKETPNQQWRRI